MNETQFSRAKALLNSEGIRVSKNGFFKLSASNRKIDATEIASALLKGAGIDAKAYLKYATAPESGNRIPDIGNWFGYMPYVSPALLEAQYNQNDAALLSRIRFAYNAIDGQAMILVNTEAATWRAVSLDIRKRAVVELARLCASSTSSEAKNLHEELTTKTEAEIHRIFKAYGKSAKDVNLELLDGALLSKLPGTMLKACSIRALVSTEIKETQNGTETHKRPHGAMFVKNMDSTAPYTVFEHLVDYAPVFMGRPELVVPIPRIFSNDPDEPALNHVDLKTLIDKNHSHPTWDRYFKRFSEDDAKVLRAFIWGIFDAENNGRQLLYIYDKDGFSGKSVLMNAIASALGSSLVAALQKDSLNNQFSIAKIWDKRLVVIGDNKNPHLIRSEKMHMILGGDTADVERKGRDSFAVKLMAKVIASGNTPLRIDPDATHERTRVIVICPKITDDILNEIAAKDKDGNIIHDSAGRPQLIGDSSFEERLISEFRSMLADAKKDYEELCPRRSSLVLPRSVAERLEDLSSDELDSVDSAIQESFNLGPDFRCSPTELREEYELALSEQLKEAISYEDFVAHLSKKYGVVKKTIRTQDDKYPKKYIGISPKN